VKRAGRTGRVAGHHGLALLAVVIAGLIVAAIDGATNAPARETCRVPRLTGLTLETARGAATRAGCRLHRTGAVLKLASVQTVGRQTPAPGHRAASVTVWTNPLCFGIAAYPPAFKEPRPTAGRTELVSGFFLVGGPLVRFSTRHCSRPPSVPEAGTVVVTDASGIVVARQSSHQGDFVKVPLAPGTYKVSGTFNEASFNGVHPKKIQQVVIPSGEAVRQDFFLDVP